MDQTEGKNGSDKLEFMIILLTGRHTYSDESRTLIMVENMPYLLGKAEVKDFGEWNSNFYDNDSYRTEHGQTGYQVFQSVDDPDVVVVLFEWNETEDARAFFESEGMRQRLEDAGVKGQPELTSLERVDQKP